MNSRTPAFEVFRGTINKGTPEEGTRFFWRLRAANGEIVADGAEAYTRRAEAVKGAERVKELASAAAIEVLA